MNAYRAVSSLCLICLAMLLLAACLLLDDVSMRSNRWLGSIAGELVTTFRDPGTQWMVFVCCVVYFVTFSLLQQCTSGVRFWRLENADFWLAATVLLVVVSYACSYEWGSSSTYALVLLGTVTLGKGAAVWAQWRASNFRHRTPSLSPVGAERVSAWPKTGVPIGTMLILLVVAVFLRSETGRTFDYRGQNRWSGPWDNPNIFGMLMAVGFVLAAGLVVSRVRWQVARDCKEKSEVQRLKAKVERVWLWFKVLLFGIAAVVCGIGLVKSYSRGAWLAVLCGLSYLGFEALRNSLLQEARAVQWIRRNGFSLVFVMCALAVLAFWQFRDTKRPIARRAFSVANVNDFSWRNRVAAWEGALQMMAYKPWFGFGWNQPERIYDNYYRAHKVVEGAAIQMNGYFTLGTATGLPTLFCFGAYLRLNLARTKFGVSPLRSPTAKARERGTPSVKGCGESPQSARAVACGTIAQDDRLEACPALEFDLFRATCRAGAIVLLVGFWFDGGLFKLATAAPFWILLELGRRDLGTDKRSAVKPPTK